MLVLAGYLVVLFGKINSQHLNSFTYSLKICCDGQVKPPANQVTAVTVQEVLTVVREVKRKSGGGGGPPQTSCNDMSRKQSFNMTTV